MAVTARWDHTTMDLGAVAALRDELLDWRYKGLPPTGRPCASGSSAPRAGTRWVATWRCR
jgi:hypothetical protein